MKQFRNFKKAIFFLLLAMIWTFSAAAEVGVTDKAVKIGSHMDLSGVIAYWGNNLRMGMQAVFNSVNETGGVFGRKIEFIIEDDQYKPPLSIAAAKKLISRDKIFAFVGPMGSQQAGATMKLAIKKDIPFVFPLSSSSIFYRPLKKNVFSLFMPYEEQGGLLVDYAIDKLNASKIGIIYQEDEVGLSGKKGVEAQLKKFGRKLHIAIPFKRGTKEFSSHVLKLKQAGPDVVIIASIIREPAAIVKEAAKLNWKPQFICQSSTGANPYFIKMAGAAAEGTIIATQALLPFSMEAGVVKYRQLLKKYFPKANPGYMSQVGYITAKIFVEALWQTGPNPTREKLIEALEGITNFETELYPPVSFSKTKHLGSDAAFLTQVEGGKFVKITDYSRPK